MSVFSREWGAGRPVIALHPLGLDASAFGGFAIALAAAGLRTVAVDLPGFGRTPALETSPTPAALARPVVELARGLAERPVVLGISLGGRVALEAALDAPDAFRAVIAVIAVAPALPWRRFRFLLAPASALLRPELAERIRLEWAWPLLRWLAGILEGMPYVRDDELAQAGARLVYYLSCPATRTSFVATARELALDPATGPTSFWTRLADLATPAAFVWCERDLLVSKRFAHHVASVRPDLRQILLPCAGHWLNGPHHRCLAHAVARLVAELAAPAAATAAIAPDDATWQRIGCAQLQRRGCLDAGPGWLATASTLGGPRA